MAIVMAGIAVASIAAGAMGRSKANKKAKEAGYIQAANIRLETAETVRRTERSDARKQSGGKGAAYAGGLTFAGGSNERYIRDMQAEMARELDWMKKSGEATADAVQRGAQVQYSAAQWSNFSQAGAAMGQSVMGAMGK